MKEKIQRLLQRILGFENYLFYFSRFKIYFMKSNEHEKEFFEFIKLIPPGGAILDIGANIGMTTVPLAKTFPGSTVHAFEPIPANNVALKRVIQHYDLKNARQHEIALGEEDGELKLIVPIVNGVRMQGLSHVYNEGSEEKGDIYRIPVKRLDQLDFLQAEKSITAIKIDVENYEYYVLKGAKALLAQHKPIIFCELWDNEMRQPVIDFLKTLGYSVKTLEDDQLVDFTGGSAAINFIFIQE